MGKSAQKKADRGLVAIVWVTGRAVVDENGDCPISTLTGYDGVRTYERDNYDGRIDLGRDRAKDGPIPFFEKFSEAFDYMVANRDKQVQIPAWMARKLFE